jgi:hypothetical protein
MDDLRQLEARGLARARAHSRRRRVATIRRRTIRGSLALFAILWAVVFAEIASGNDPALDSGKQARRAASPEPSPSPVLATKPETEPEPELEEEVAPETEAPVVTSSS